MSHPFLVVVVALKAANSKIPPVYNFLETQLCVGPIWSQLSWRHNFVLLSCGLPKVNWGAGHIFHFETFISQIEYLSMEIQTM